MALNKLAVGSRLNVAGTGTYRRVARLGTLYNADAASCCKSKLQDIPVGHFNSSNSQQALAKRPQANVWWLLHPVGPGLPIASARMG